MITTFAEFQAYTIWLSGCRLCYSLGYMISDFLFTGTCYLTVCSQVHATWLFVHRYMTVVYRYMTSYFLFTVTWHLTVCLQVHDIWRFVYRYMISDCLFTGTWHLTFCLQAHNIWLFVLYTEIWYLTALMEDHWCPWMSGTPGGGSVSALGVSLVSCLVINTLNVRDKQDVEMISFNLMSLLLMFIDLIDS